MLLSDEGTDPPRSADLGILLAWDLTMRVATYSIQYWIVSPALSLRRDTYSPYQTSVEGLQPLASRTVLIAHYPQALDPMPTPTVPWIEEISTFSSAVSFT